MKPREPGAPAVPTPCQALDKLLLLKRDVCSGLQHHTVHREREVLAACGGSRDGLGPSSWVLANRVRGGSEKLAYTQKNYGENSP